MANYTKTTNFTSKDSLSTGNPLKIIRGSEHDTEYSNIATAIQTKADLASPALTGTATAVNITVSGNLLVGSDTVTTNTATQTLTNKTISGYVATSDIGSTVQGYDANTAKLNVTQSFTKAQRGTIVSLTDGSTITPDFSLGNNYSVTLGGNRTLANPTNITAGQSGVIVITQDGTGSRTLAYGSYFKFAGGTAPTLTTTAAAVDVLAYYVESSTRITAKLIADVK
jgi:hypothetical protein